MIVGNESVLRRLPAVGALLETPRCRELASRHGHSALTWALREAVQERRDSLSAAQAAPDDLSEQIITHAAALLHERARGGLRPVINATGVIVHTNLGRSVLAQAAAQAAFDIARSYSNLEANLEAGRRASRHDHIERRLQELLGVEAGAVFNNNAAAVMLALAALARDREVIVSRGQLVEIGGSFRIPEVIAHSGCILREVGATNRTHLRDYEQAIGENTAAILHAHHSNYRIIGFASEPSIRELADLGRARGLPVIVDLGSGALFDLAALGVGQEPTAPETLAAGADLVTFSGDKLLSGPQCGIAVGRADLVERMKRHPFARAVRVDKMTIAALAATLDIIADPQRALHELPTLRAATEPVDQVRRRAEALAAAIREGAPPGPELCVVTDRSARVGGGSLPEQQLDTAAVHVGLPQAKALAQLARLLRMGDPAVYPRIEDDALVLDARTIFPHQVDDAARAVAAALAELMQ